MNVFPPEATVEARRMKKSLKIIPASSLSVSFCQRFIKEEFC